MNQEIEDEDEDEDDWVSSGRHLSPYSGDCGIHDTAR
jgi:hypothetical protein